MIHIKKHFLFMFQSIKIRRIGIAVQLVCVMFMIYCQLTLLGAEDFENSNKQYFDILPTDMRNQILHCFANNKESLKNIIDLRPVCHDFNSRTQKLLQEYISFKGIKDYNLSSHALLYKDLWKFSVKIHYLSDIRLLTRGYLKENLPFLYPLVTSNQESCIQSLFGLRAYDFFSNISSTYETEFEVADSQCITYINELGQREKSCPLSFAYAKIDKKNSFKFKQNIFEFSTNTLQQKKIPRLIAFTTIDQINRTDHSSNEISEYIDNAINVTDVIEEVCVIQQPYIHKPDHIFVYHASNQGNDNSNKDVNNNIKKSESLSYILLYQNTSIEHATIFDALVFPASALKDRQEEWQSFYNQFRLWLEEINKKTSNSKKRAFCKIYFPSNHSGFLRHYQLFLQSWPIFAQQDDDNHTIEISFLSYPVLENGKCFDLNTISSTLDNDTYNNKHNHPIVGKLQYAVGMPKSDLSRFYQTWIEQHMYYSNLYCNVYQVSPYDMFLPKTGTKRLSQYGIFLNWNKSRKADKLLQLIMKEEVEFTPRDPRFLLKMKELDSTEIEDYKADAYNSETYVKKLINDIQVGKQEMVNEFFTHQALMTWETKQQIIFTFIRNSPEALCNDFIRYLCIYYIHDGQKRGDMAEIINFLFSNIAECKAYISVMLQELIKVKDDEDKKLLFHDIIENFLTCYNSSAPGQRDVFLNCIRSLINENEDLQICCILYVSNKLNELDGAIQNSVNLIHLILQKFIYVSSLKDTIFAKINCTEQDVINMLNDFIKQYDSVTEIILFHNDFVQIVLSNPHLASMCLSKISMKTIVKHIQKAKTGDREDVRQLLANYIIKQLANVDENVATDDILCLFASEVIACFMPTEIITLVAISKSRKFSCLTDLMLENIVTNNMIPEYCNNNISTLFAIASKFFPQLFTAQEFINFILQKNKNHLEEHKICSENIKNSEEKKLYYKYCLKHLPSTNNESVCCLIRDDMEKHGCSAEIIWSLLLKCQTCAQAFNIDKISNVAYNTLCNKITKKIIGNTQLQIDNLRLFLQANKTRVDTMFDKIATMACKQLNRQENFAIHKKFLVSMYQLFDKIVEPDFYLTYANSLAAQFIRYVLTEKNLGDDDIMVIKKFLQRAHSNEFLDILYAQLENELEKGAKPSDLFLYLVEQNTTFQLKCLSRLLETDKITQACSTFMKYCATPLSRLQPISLSPLQAKKLTLLAILCDNGYSLEPGKNISQLIKEYITSETLTQIALNDIICCDPHMITNILSMKVFDLQTRSRIYEKVAAFCQSSMFNGDIKRKLLQHITFEENQALSEEECNFIHNNSLLLEQYSNNRKDLKALLFINKSGKLTPGKTIKTLIKELIHDTNTEISFNDKFQYVIHTDLSLLPDIFSQGKTVEKLNTIIDNIDNVKNMLQGDNETLSKLIQALFFNQDGTISSDIETIKVYLDQLAALFPEQRFSEIKKIKLLHICNVLRANENLDDLIRELVTTEQFKEILRLDPGVLENVFQAPITQEKLRSFLVVSNTQTVLRNIDLKIFKLIMNNVNLNQILIAVSLCRMYGHPPLSLVEKAKPLHFKATLFCLDTFFRSLTRTILTAGALLFTTLLCHQRKQLPRVIQYVKKMF